MKKLKFSWNWCLISEKLHRFHNDLPFLPERMKIEKVEKLAANLHDKTEYAIPGFNNWPTLCTYVCLLLSTCPWFWKCICWHLYSFFPYDFFKIFKIYLVLIILYCLKTYCYEFELYFFVLRALPNLECQSENKLK